MDFGYSKVQVSKRTRMENFHFLGFFETNRPVGAKPLNKCANIIADSETFKRYGDFDTWVGRWLNWNDGIIIFSHYFLTNVVITGYLSYSMVISLSPVKRKKKNAFGLNIWFTQSCCDLNFVVIYALFRPNSNSKIFRVHSP